MFAYFADDTFDDEEIAKKLQAEFNAEDDKMKQKRLKQEEEASYKKTVTGMVGMSMFEMMKTQFDEVTDVKTRKKKGEEDSSSEDEDLTERVKRLKK